MLLLHAVIPACAGMTGLNYVSFHSAKVQASI